MARHSGTHLWKKLGTRSGARAAVLHPPDDYHALAGGGPEAHWGEVSDGVEFVHFFTASRAELEKKLEECLSKMARDGMIWVNWPKKSSGFPSEISEDTIREVALPLGLVDVKVCAVDKTWSGLKLVIRKALR